MKYMPDLLRQEPRNIGVIASIGSEAAGRFLGETQAGALDLRRLPRDLFNDKRVYLEWREYWRGALASPSESLMDTLLEDNSGAYYVRPGGQAFVRGDLISLQELVDDLFIKLVQTKEPALQLAIADEDSLEGLAARPSRSPRLALDIKSRLKAMGILENKRYRHTLFSEHPVRYRVPVQGSMVIPHEATFVQENGKKFVMEHVDFSNSERGREHAGYATYMLSDIAEAETGPPVQPIAIVNRVGRSSEAVDYGMSALSGVPGIRIVLWDDELQRLRFLEERRAIANVKG